MKLHSTGALTPAAREAQDRLHATAPHYDTVIIGTGMSALTAGALLAGAGHRVCMLEAHDVPGGMAHTFRMGEYHFCAQVHYIWGCAPGGRIYEFLRKIGLERDITFEPLDPDGYDRISLPDGKRVFIPCGFEKLIANIDQAYPGQGAAVRRFTDILQRLHAAIDSLPEQELSWWKLLPRLPWLTSLLRYRHRTLQEVLDACGVAREAQAILVADAGDLMAPPRELSILAYCQLFSGYNSGAYYPTRHFRYFTERLARFITDHGGHIFYETEVTGFHLDGDRVTSVECADGKRFHGDRFVCNMDPQKAAGMIGWEHFPPGFREPLGYSYSPSGMVIYLGLEGLDLREHGFGRFNTWHLEQWDMNAMWQEQQRHDFTRPWIFMSTPSLNTPDRSTTPPGGQILEVATYCEHEEFARLRRSSTHDYLKAKSALASKLLDIVERDYLPDLRQHIAVKVVGTPLTHEAYCHAPRGNAYGSMLVPQNIGLNRLKARTPFENLKWCNASSGFAGVHGTVGTGISLYEDLTGDRFYERVRPGHALSGGSFPA